MGESSEAQRAGAGASLLVPALPSPTTPQIEMAVHDLRATLARLSMVAQLVEGELDLAGPVHPAGTRGRLRLSALQDEITLIERQLHRLLEASRTVA